MIENMIFDRNLIVHDRKKMIIYDRNMIEYDKKKLATVLQDMIENMIYDRNLIEYDKKYDDIWLISYKINGKMREKFDRLW